MFGIPFGKEKVKAGSAVITPLGKQKLESDAGVGTPYKILSELNDNGGSCSIQDLAQTCGIPPQKASAIVKNMAQHGYVRLQASGMSEF